MTTDKNDKWQKITEKRQMEKKQMTNDNGQKANNNGQKPNGNQSFNPQNNILHTTVLTVTCYVLTRDKLSSAATLATASAVVCSVQYTSLPHIYMHHSYACHTVLEIPNPNCSN